jgi:hypothetical protein
MESFDLFFEPTNVLENGDEITFLKLMESVVDVSQKIQYYFACVNLPSITLKDICTFVVMYANPTFQVSRKTISTRYMRKLKQLTTQFNFLIYKHDTLLQRVLDIDAFVSKFKGCKEMGIHGLNHLFDTLNQLLFDTEMLYQQLCDTASMIVDDVGQPIAQKHSSENLMNVQEKEEIDWLFKLLNTYEKYKGTFPTTTYYLFTYYRTIWESLTDSETLEISDITDMILGGHSIHLISLNLNDWLKKNYDLFSKHNLHCKLTVQ